MKDFSRRPTRTEQWLAILLSLLAMAGFGAISSVLWLYGRSHLATGLFVVLFLASTWLLFRAVHTAPRALGTAETSALAWFFLVLGAGAVITALLIPTFSVHRLMILGSGLSLLGAGLGGFRRSASRDA